MNKTELLKNVSLFSKLGAPELDLVSDYSEYRAIAKDGILFEEGALQEELYIIAHGEVVVSKTTDAGKAVDVARFVRGDCFGELSILDGKPRTATAAATEDTEVLVFPRKGMSFQTMIAQHPEVSAPILHKLLAIVAARIRSTNELISERSPWVQDLRRQLLSDELTGLYNRTFLDENFPGELPGYGDQTCVLMIKPDNFKAVNDTYGHEAGDIVLRELAATIKASLRASDIAVRYRGNEIAAILPVTDPQEARGVGETVRAAIARIDVERLLGGKRVELTGSVGIAVYPHDSADPKTLVELAFARMWEARESGGNRVAPVVMEPV